MLFSVCPKISPLLIPLKFQRGGGKFYRDHAAVLVVLVAGVIFKSLRWRAAPVLTGYAIAYFSFKIMHRLADIHRMELCKKGEDTLRGAVEKYGMWFKILFVLSVLFHRSVPKTACFGAVLCGLASVLKEGVPSVRNFEQKKTETGRVTPI